MHSLYLCVNTFFLKLKGKQKQAKYSRVFQCILRKTSNEKLNLKPSKENKLYAKYRRN